MIRSLLTNPIYTGDMVWNRRTLGRFHRISGKAAVPRQGIAMARVTMNDSSDWIVFKNAHPAIVERDVFETARLDRETRPTAASQLGIPKPRGGWRSQFVLSGLVYCGRCGHRYQGITKAKGKRKVDGSVVKTCYYTCSGYIKGGLSVCRPGTIPQEVLEQVVKDAVLKFYGNYLAHTGEKALARAFEKAIGTEGQEANQLSTARVNVLTQQTLEFARHLESALNGAAEEKRAAFRQCVRRVLLSGNLKSIDVELALIPAITCSTGNARNVRASIPNTHL
jgi:hypothetical protein